MEVVPIICKIYIRFNKSFDVSKDVFNGSLAKTHENAVIWLFSHFQYVLVAVAFSVSSHFRLPMRTNIPFMYYLVLISIVLVALLLQGDVDVVSQVFSLQKGVPIVFRVVLLLTVVLDAIIALGIEWILVDKVIREIQLRKERDDPSNLVMDSPISASPTRHYYGF